MAIGEFSGSTLPNGGSAWGIVADYLVGRMLIGNNLLIQNDSNTFEVTQLGATLTNAVLTVDNFVNTIHLDPTLGINIYSKPLSKTVFSVDGNGNAVFSGAITAATMTASEINGTTINGGTINGTTGNFSGNVYAANLVGLVTMEQLQDIIASKITSGKMAAARINGMEDETDLIIRFSKYTHFSDDVSVSGGLRVGGVDVATQVWVSDFVWGILNERNYVRSVTSSSHSTTARNSTNTGTITFTYVDDINVSH